MQNLSERSFAQHRSKHRSNRQHTCHDRHGTHWLLAFLPLHVVCDLAQSSSTQTEDSSSRTRRLKTETELATGTTSGRGSLQLHRSSSPSSSSGCRSPLTRTALPLETRTSRSTRRTEQLTAMCTWRMNGRASDADGQRPMTSGRVHLHTVWHRYPLQVFARTHLWLFKLLLCCSLSHYALPCKLSADRTSRMYAILVYR